MKTKRTDYRKKGVSIVLDAKKKKLGKIPGLEREDQNISIGKKKKNWYRGRNNMFKVGKRKREEKEKNLQKHRERSGNGRVVLRE